MILSPDFREALLTDGIHTILNSHRWIFEIYSGSLPAGRRLTGTLLGRSEPVSMKKGEAKGVRLGIIQTGTAGYLLIYAAEMTIPEIMRYAALHKKVPPDSGKSLNILMTCGTSGAELNMSSNNVVSGSIVTIDMFKIELEV